MRYVHMACSTDLVAVVHVSNYSFMILIIERLMEGFVVNGGISQVS